MTAFFRAEAEQGEASDPDLLARQLSVVFDGASARAGIGADSLAGLIAPSVATLLARPTGAPDRSALPIAGGRGRTANTESPVGQTRPSAGTAAGTTRARDAKPRPAASEARHFGDLAKRTGASVRSLRHHEEQGLLSSERSASGQRHYDEDAVSRMLLIRQFFAVGMTGKVIAALLPHLKDPGGCCPPAVLRQLTAERDLIDAQSDELARARHSLDALIRTTQEAMRGAVPTNPT
ncbi:MerR family transcriptional regulator [Nonomuraea sp. NPDC052129]|uniref:MerR family transcriptional regulator n=1 Tax=Nonomuraea sp. NPDC052129 TaxID=3154651 RepID=UPI003438EFF5